MSVISIDKDYEALSLVLTAEFDAPVERIWELWADPRQLERWWGPPSHPATVEEHDLAPGGTVTYFMTGPDGERYRGWWRIAAATPPRALAFTDGFANADGSRNDELPTTEARVALTERGDGTRMEIRSTFGSREQMDELVRMGMDEGLRQAVGQIDEILAGAPR